MSKERPILFSAPMVRAILYGRKSQTRRIIKPQPVWIAEPYVPFRTADANPKGIINCPYGTPGDRLWVRETFEWMNHCVSGYPVGDPFCRYRADYVDGVAYGKWKPSIHMPRSASRILLEITNVRVEWLQYISNDDVVAEGVYAHQDHHSKTRDSIYSPLHAYRDLWESINGEGSWDLNPWVWVIGFKQIDYINSERALSDELKTKIELLIKNK